MNINTYGFHFTPKLYRFEMITSSNIMKISKLEITKIQIQTQQLGLESLKKMLEEGSLLVKIGKEYATTKSLESEKKIEVLKTKTDKDGNITEKKINVDLRNLTEAEMNEVIAYIESTFNDSKEEIKKNQETSNKSTHTHKRSNTHFHGSVNSESSPKNAPLPQKDNSKNLKQEKMRLQKELEQERTGKHRRKDREQEELVQSNFDKDKLHAEEAKKIEAKKSH